MITTYRTALSISGEIENQASVDRVNGDPRGILGRLDRIWEIIDDARRVNEPPHGIPDDGPYEYPLPVDAPFDVPLTREDLVFAINRLEEGNEVTRELLSGDLDPVSRGEQEEGLELGISAVEELRRLVSDR
ncbi:hypothetical protein AB3M83_01740 [Microbacterium sp. 179-B 1A2 NHS]|uniref:hypothetical protein n=1 Tax=Microbacterium sp. 179-B 1A2 NHS TaxID=3142383 RepID=UPI0039A36678